MRRCLSCGSRAVMCNEDGQYCKPCMQIHLVEKMFVNLTEMQRPKSTVSAQPRNDLFENEGRESSEAGSDALSR